MLIGLIMETLSNMNNKLSLSNTYKYFKFLILNLYMYQFARNLLSIELKSHRKK